MVKRQKTETIAPKGQKTRRKLVCLVNKKISMKLILEIKQVLTKQMMNTYCKSERQW